MKKIINGKLYDTDSSNVEKIGIYWNGYGDAFNYVRETLYRKIKTKEYFKYVNAGPLSEYGEPFSNGWVGYTDIVPLSEEEAREFAMTKLEADEYMSAFGSVEE